jgi:hypothetical protein
MSVKINRPQPATLEKMVQTIQNRNDFVRFVRALHADVNVGEWENATLPAYLEAVASWSEDMDGYFKNQQEPVPDQPSWKLLGQILLAATVYE